MGVVGPHPLSGRGSVAFVQLSACEMVELVMFVWANGTMLVYRLLQVGVDGTQFIPL